MTIEEAIQPLRDELRAVRDELRTERETRRRENEGYESCVEDMSRMLNGIQAALIGSVHSQERGIRETVNTHEVRLDDQLARIKHQEVHPSVSLSTEDVKKLKEMPAAGDIRAGLSNMDKMMVYGSVVASLIGWAVYYFKK